MQLTFENATKLSLKELLHIEMLFGKDLPEYLKDFYKNYAGATPEIEGKRSCLTITHPKGWTQSNYIENVDDFNSLQIHLSNIQYLLEHAEDFALSDDYVEPESLFPICNLPNGAVYVAIDGKHKGKVYTADNGDFGIIYHSENFDAFWTSLFADD